MPLFDETFRDIVDLTIWNHRQNIARIEQKFADDKEAIDAKRDSRLAEIKKQGEESHEDFKKKLMATWERNNQSAGVAYRDMEDRIRVLLDTKNYAEAAGEKRRLAELMEETCARSELETRLNENTHKKTWRARKRRDRGIVLQAHRRKMLRITQERDRQIGEQRSMLISQLKTQLRTFAGWVYGLNCTGTSKRDLAMRFEGEGRKVTHKNLMDDVWSDGKSS
jgi:hypothetical protein